MPGQHLHFQKPKWISVESASFEEITGLLISSGSLGLPQDWFPPTERARENRSALTSPLQVSRVTILVFIMCTCLCPLQCPVALWSLACEGHPPRAPSRAAQEPARSPSGGWRWQLRSLPGPRAGAAAVVSDSAVFIPLLTRAVHKTTDTGGFSPAPVLLVPLHSAWL